MWGASLISALMGTRLPGPGAIYLEQTLRFRHPVMIRDTITVSVTAVNKDPPRKRISLDCRCVNQGRKGAAPVPGRSPGRPGARQRPLSARPTTPAGATDTADRILPTRTASSPW
jgi:hypothetical protein